MSELRRESPQAETHLGHAKIRAQQRVEQVLHVDTERREAKIGVRVLAYAAAKIGRSERERARQTESRAHLRKWFITGGGMTWPVFSAPTIAWKAMPINLPSGGLIRTRRRVERGLDATTHRY